VYVNAAVSALALQREISSVGPNPPRVYFGVYDFETVRVRCQPEAVGTNDGVGFRPAPTTADELVRYAAEVADAFLNLDEEDRNRNCKLTMKW